MDPNQPIPAPTGGNTLADKLGRWWHSLNGPMRTIAVLAIVLGIGLLSMALYVALQEEQQTPEPTTQVSQPTADVSITDDGLNPSTITIDAGTQLTWTNNDDEPHQIAADPHPLNNSIEGFDSDTVLQPGDSFSFTFEESGTFKVHDHLDYLEDEYHGTIVVN